MGIGINIPSNGIREPSRRFSNFNEFMRICDSFDNIMINVFKLKDQKFSYYSISTNKILGYCPKQLTKGGWNLWYSFVKTSELPIVHYRITEFLKDAPLQDRRRQLTLTYHLKKATQNWAYIRHDLKLEKISRELFAVSYIYDHSETELADHYLIASEEKLDRLQNSSPLMPVSDREKQVLKLIGCGLSSKQIADKLFISIHTAISHRKNLIEKFNAKNTAELIKEASRIISL